MSDVLAVLSVIEVATLALCGLVALLCGLVFASVLTSRWSG